MIASLRGLLTEKRAESIVLEVNGVGYLVYTSSSSLFNLKEQQEVFLFIESVTKETGTSLYGFKEKGEQDVFNLLVTVQGVGPKIAMAALSVFDYSKIIHAISIADDKTLKQIPGVGAKAAIRIVTELKDKVVKLNIGNNTALKESKNTFTLQDDLLITLTSLGYKESEAQKAIESIAENNYQEQELQKAVKDALKYFAD